MMVEHMLVEDEWYELTDLDDATFATLEIQGSGVVIAAFGEIEPASTSAGYLLPEGLHQLAIPSGKSLWVRLTSGTADLIYSQADPAEGTCTFLWDITAPYAWVIHEDNCGGGYTATQPGAPGDYDQEVRAGTCEL